jgi:tetratricopeptide (TPR) repeat protein
MVVKKLGWIIVAGLVSFPARAQVDSRAEGYYLYCLGRMYEMEGQAELSMSHYREAVEKDPAAAYPHLALAELLANSNQAGKAVESANRALELDSELGDAHRLLGNLYIQLARAQSDEGLIGKALDEFQQTIQLEPSDVESRQRLAELHFMLGENEKATAQLETLLEYAPDSFYAMYRLAQVAKEKGDLRRATELFQGAIEAEPRHQASRLELGRVLTELGEFEQASTVYREALELTPRDARLRVQLAYALAYSGELEPSAVQFQRVLESENDNLDALLGLALVRRNLRELEVAQALLQKVLESEPGSVRARAALAGVYQDMRDYPAASIELDGLLSLPDRSYPTSQRAEYLVQFGLARQQLDDHRAAIEAFEKARDITRDDVRFEAALIQSLLAAEQTDRAAEVCRKALVRFSEDERLQILDAQIEFEQGRKQEAVDKLLELVQKSPNPEFVAGAVVELYQRGQRYEEAEQFLRDTLEDTVESDRLVFQLGAVLERQGNYDEAEAMFTKVLEATPDNAPALNYLGYMLVDRGVRLEESLDYIKRAVTLDPYNGAYLDSLGWAYFKLGRLDLAEENLLKAIKGLRLTGVVYDHLGDIYYQRGKRDEAIRSWQKALDQDDDEELEKDEVARKIERAQANR